MHNLYLIALGHEEIQVWAGEDQFKISFDQTKIGRVAVESVDADDQM